MNYLLHPLTLVTFFPLVGVLILLFLRPEQKNAARWVALVASLVTFGISLAVLAQFNPSNPDLQLVVDLPWIPLAGWEIHYFLGVDGLSILLLLLDHFAGADLDPFDLDRGRRPGERFHDLLPAARSRHGRCFPGAGPVPVLCLLGIYPGADVFPDRHLGRTAAHVCGGQILPVHDGRLDPDAAGNLVAGDLPGQFPGAGR